MGKVQAREECCKAGLSFALNAMSGNADEDHYKSDLVVTAVKMLFTSETSGPLKCLHHTTENGNCPS